MTEKLDGSNTLIHRRRVYGRSVTGTTRGKWMAMVKKHLAWKVQEPDVLLYGEDIYAVHSIEYGPVREDRTFYAFALRHGDTFAPFCDIEAYCADHDIAVVPLLFRGTFQSVSALRDFVTAAHEQASALGGVREGIVIRRAEGFGAEQFGQSVCKSVRAEHLRTSEDWRRSWRACRTKPARSSP
ncbi:MAG: RNA ligase family protein [Gammaproteobacteria bacterium]|nr:RNA ligase family protein [Gammaproteobacteria bacterium]